MLIVITKQKTMLKIIIVIFIFSCYWSFGQEHSSLFQSETIKKNKVYKILEYSPLDSVRFFEQYPEGNYSKFDQLGRMTQSNYYSPFEIEGVWHPNMYKNYYLYDSLDHQIGFVQIHDEMESPFRFLEVRSYNLTTDTIKIAQLAESYQRNSQFIFKTEQQISKPPYFGDTLQISKMHNHLKSLTDSSVTMDIYLNKSGFKDSTIFKSIGTGQNGNYKSETISIYTYYKNGNVKTIIQKRYHIKNSRELYSIEEYHFLENDLLDVIKSYYNINKEWKLKKFKYFFRKD